MIRIPFDAFVAVVALVGMTTSGHAQAPAGQSSVRHVRQAPIKVGRLVSAPVLDSLGSFSPLPERVRGVTVIGIVQNHAGGLVPNAGVVILRDLTSGRPTASTPVNDLAQFSMRGVPEGFYLAELVAASGAVIATTPAFTAAAGQVIQIAHTIPAAPASGFVRGLRSATQSVLATAASSGVLAVTPGVPVSPPR